MTKIMLVEDDNNLREIYEARLAAEGYEIVSAQDGEAALAIAAKERPDMIISDVMMPKISGFEMLDILRNTEALRNVKIIMLTALGQAEDSSRANSLGADRYLVKSQVTLEDIVKATHELLDSPTDAAAAPAEDTPQEAPMEKVEIPEPAIAYTPEAAAPVAQEPVASTFSGEDSVQPEPPQTFEPTLPATELAVAVEPVESTEPAPVAEPVGQPAAPTVPRSIPVQDFSSESSDSSVSTDASVYADDADSSDTASSGQTPADLFQAPVTDTSVPAADPIIGDDSASSSISAVPATEPASVENPTELHPISNLPITPEPSVDTLDTLGAPSEEPGVSSDIPVIPPPVSEEAVNAAEEPDESTPSEPQVDYTSPDSFNSFQAPPSEPVATPEPTPDLDLQTSSDEESSMKAQIDDFVNASDAGINGPLEVTARPEQTSDIPNEPVAEELDYIAPPVIEAPENSVVPEPVPVAVPSEQPEPAAEESFSSEDDELIAAAAEDLAPTQESGTSEASSPSNGKSAPATATPTTGTTDAKMRTVAPLSSNTEQPSIHQLLELEEAKNSAAQVAAQEPSSTQAGAPSNPQPNINAYNPSASTGSNRPDTDSTDPDSISL